MKNLVEALKNDFSIICEKNLSDDDFTKIAKNIGYTREPDFFVEILSRKFRQEYDDFSAFSRENQVKVLEGMAFKIHQEYEDRLYRTLRKIFMERLDFGQHDHRFSCLDELVKEIGLTSKPYELVNLLVDNLSRVYKLLKPISVQEGIRRFHRQNVQDQSLYLIKAASFL